MVYWVTVAPFRGVARGFLEIVKWSFREQGQHPALESHLTLASKLLGALPIFLGGRRS
jgi:hypothetical protein